MIFKQKIQSYSHKIPIYLFEIAFYNWNSFYNSETLIQSIYIYYNRLIITEDYFSNFVNNYIIRTILYT